MTPLQNVAIAGVSETNVSIPNRPPLIRIKGVWQHWRSGGQGASSLWLPCYCPTKAIIDCDLSEGFTVKKVVHDSFDSWKAALEGQDAIISFLTPPATEYQNLAADAAVAANVKRFIPSEWGMNTTILDNTIFGKLLSDKTTTQSHLAKLSKDNDFFSWTGISTGLWFDWVN